MKNIIVNNMLSIIQKTYNYDDIKLKEIKYGLESFYLTITKTIVIFGIAYILGLFRSLTLLMIFYGLLRLSGFGLHAKKSWQCWLSSGIIFIFVPYLCEVIVINKYIQIIIAIVCSLIILKYAPADTEKRPIVSKKRRLIYKVLCFVTSLIYLTIIVLINNSYFENILMFSLLLQSALIMPISYKIFKLKYNNYLNYLKKQSA